MAESWMCRRQVAAFALCLLAGAGSLRAASTAPQPRSPAEYRDHLKSLEMLVTQCGERKDSAHCSVDAVGPDDSVTVPGQKTKRRISYDWLRAMLEPVGNRTISSGDAAPMLMAAAARLQLEESEAPGAPAMSYVAERKALTTILNRAEFRRADRSLTERVLDAIAIWINRRLSVLWSTARIAAGWPFCWNGE